MEFNIFNSAPRKVVCVRNDNDVWSGGEYNHLLNIGEIYTVDYVDVHGWHTDVYLNEIPDKPFSSVMFEEIGGE